MATTVEPNAGRQQVSGGGGAYFLVVIPDGHRQLPRLTSMRALAALFVFGYHLQFFGVALSGTAPLTLGYTGVGFFFVLSGFVLTWGAAPDGDRRTFWVRRLARIYPAYLVVLLVAGLIAAPGTPPRTPAGVAASTLLVQAWSLHDPRLVYALNPPSWSLSNEAFFYVVLPFLLPVLTALRPRVRLAAGAGWFLVTAAVVAEAAHHGTSWRFLAFTFPLVRSGEFLLGVLAALEIRSGRRLAAAPGAALAAAGLAMVLVLPRTTPLPDIWLDPVWLAVIVLAAQADLADRPGWLLTRRWMVYAGGVSYAFYLVHQDVLVELGRALGHGVGPAVAALMAAVLIAAAVHHLVERPGQRLILAAHRVLRGRPALAPAAGSLETGLETGLEAR